MKLVPAADPPLHRSAHAHEDAHERRGRETGDEIVQLARGRKIRRFSTSAINVITSVAPQYGASPSTS